MVHQRSSEMKYGDVEAGTMAICFECDGEESECYVWKGPGPTVLRAVAWNTGMLASYDQSVEYFMDNLGACEIDTKLWPGKKSITKSILLTERYNFDLG
ncbi:hypothetical protein L1987_30965 [Smallanthus sonchifolius]|uniref:Uncharacterized protein n=1 Tax=Smallanthus sonchifolius TaxID=185202 RepID=A0ACB9I432_9ASTR|nr:hypothetical protein L1987_30965 [Smallanthus sonchifolius]